MAQLDDPFGQGEVRQSLVGIGVAERVETRLVADQRPEAPAPDLWPQDGARGVRHPDRLEPGAPAVRVE